VSTISFYQNTNIKQKLISYNSSKSLLLTVEKQFPLEGDLSNDCFHFSSTF